VIYILPYNIYSYLLFIIYYLSIYYNYGKRKLRRSKFSGCFSCFSGDHQGTYSLANGALYLDGSASLHEIKETDLEVAGVTYTIKFRDDVISIGNYAFQLCSGLTSVTFGPSLESIGNYAFNGCRSLTSVTIPDSVTSIGEGAFRRCTSLTSVIIGTSITTIGDSAFQNCSKLESITFNFLDPGEYEQINNVSKLPLKNGISGDITYGTNIFSGFAISYYVPTQEAKYITVGCTNASAANYNSNATIDDGSCFIVGYADGVLRLDVR
jgi:hypothetical protein